MNFQNKLALCTFSVVLSISLCGCGQVGKFVGKLKFFGKGAQQGLKQGVKQGGDDVLSKERFWKTPKPKSTSPISRGAAVAAMSTAKAGATKAFRGASTSTKRCGEQLVKLTQNYTRFVPASQVAVRIIYQKLVENNSRLDDIHAQLSDPNLSDSEAAQLQAECDNINQLNKRIEAKIETLTAELG
ncbi:MAG TPA: hypothetical protein DIT97_10465 [Gimesia maris]|mgnify:CR=1 FL=1|uniref:Lipoprotein n=1 Tax=Gimesia maris TaxID=122 RepID=A0A3D3R3W5_9PLAN|nr:hypothetical protein [Gimesia maris]